MSGAFYRWGFWVRLGRHGYGLSVTTDRPFFSERHGFRTVLRLWGVGFEILKPYKPSGEKGPAGDAESR